MARATIRLYLDEHRSRALQLEHNTRQAEQAYDANIGDYLRFLQGEAVRQDFAVTTAASGPTVFAIDEADHAAKKAAHDWLETQPDIWNWIP